MRLSWETVAALAVVVVGVVVAAIFVPAATWEALGALPWESLAGAVMVVLGGLGLTLGGPLVRRGGGGGAALLLAIGLGAATLSGCGAGALQQHATAATVLTVGVAGAGEVAVASVEAALGECSDEACVERIDREVRPAVATAHESLRVGVIAYREAVAIAAAAQAGDGVLDALMIALARVVREWDALAAALSSLLREELPGLPPFVRALLDALASGGGS